MCTEPSAHTTRAESEAVDREAILATDPSLAAAERESRDAGLRHHAAGHDEAECLRLAIDVAPQRAALHARDSGVRIDIDAAHPREVDDHAAVTARMTRHGVAATADGDEELVLAGELHGVDHVGRPRAPHDERGTPLMHRVVDRLVRVSGITGLQHVSANRRAELLERGVVDARPSAVHCCD